MNPLIDIGTDRLPSLIGFVWLLDNHEGIEALAEALRAFLLRS